MKTIKKIEIEPIFIDGFMPDYKSMEEGKLYISEEYGTIIHRCLCGCGEKTVLPIHPIHGWNLIKENNDKISLTPSVGNYQLPCQSHYIITNNIANFV